ncbi:MAG: hypothetical protein ACK4IY_09720 [Chitinophagales bacterium]
MPGSMYVTSSGMGDSIAGNKYTPATFQALISSLGKFYLKNSPVIMANLKGTGHLIYDP